MELTLNLAGTSVTISFLDQAKKAAPWCRSLFRGFVQPGKGEGSRIDVSILKKTNGRFLVRSTARNPVFEQLLPTEEVAAWLEKSPGYTEDFPISKRTISSFCLGGLLLYNPDIAAGRMYLLEQGPACFRPLYRLLWMYLAQVLGERGACFIHAAALAKGEDGYLFMGDSGAGKSTFVRLCPEYRALSDDGPIITGWNGEYRVCPSPYHQMDPEGGLDEETLRMNARIRGLYFLIKDDRSFLERVPKKEAFSMTLQRHIHFFPYLSAQAKSALFDLFFEVCYELPAYYLHFSMKPGSLEGYHW